MSSNRTVRFGPKEKDMQALWAAGQLHRPSWAKARVFVNQVTDSNRERHQRTRHSQPDSAPCQRRTQHLWFITLFIDSFPLVKTFCSFYQLLYCLTPPRAPKEALGIFIVYFYSWTWTELDNLRNFKLQWKRAQFANCIKIQISIIWDSCMNMEFLKRMYHVIVSTTVQH